MKFIFALLFVFIIRPSYCVDWMILPQMDNPFMSLYNESSGGAVVNLYDEVNQLVQKYEDARNKEQATENKLLGAIGIGATGIGGMKMMSAAAEMSADQDAEDAMRAYLATFRCNYGDGKNVLGGRQEVALPGGNELMALYAEYVALANELRVRKAALGMRPGIEAESILDKVTSGMYDNATGAKTSGVFASLARALSDPNSADAAAWAQYKKDSASGVKKGAIISGAGAVGSAIGNMVINHPTETTDSNAIKK